MGKFIKYLFLVLLLAGLGWKVYRAYLAPQPETETAEESEVQELEIGDSEEMITKFYGQTGAARTRSGVKTYFFTDTEIDVVNGKVSAIRSLNNVKGTLKSGDEVFSIDDDRNIQRQ